MARSGIIYTTDEVKSQLAESNRQYYGQKTWENLYNSIDYAKQEALGLAKQNYSQEMADAYASAYRSDQSILSSNLGQGYKTAALDETEQALQEAYNTYKQNYLSNVATIESNVAKQTASVTDALTTESENTTKLANSFYEYLKALWEKYQEGDVEDNIFYNKEIWNRYTNPVLNEKGKATGELELKSWDEIAAWGAYEDGTSGKEWTGLFDDKGNLTIKGVDFYDQMMNSEAVRGGALSYGDWLYEYDKDLYEWSSSYNPYNYTEAGTNLGSFKTMVGLTSTDQTYAFIERFGGMTASEVDNLYSDFESKLNKISEAVNSDKGFDSKDITKDVKGVVKDLKTLTDKLDITADFEAAIDMSFDDLAKQVADNAKNTKSNWNMLWTNSLKPIASTATTAVQGAAIGSKLGGAHGAGIGAAIGGVIGFIGGTGQAISDSSKQRKANRAYAKESKELYENMLIALIQYSQAKQREAQISYYK